tara:strand:+ start:21666 stop:22733 length:1068 start_codon:yes stop_codon:yes gene_type:complete
MISIKKAQTNLEYFFLTLLLLAFLLPFVYNALQAAHKSHQILSADNVLNDVESATGSVYELGPGNQKTVYVKVPNGITGSVVKGNILSIDVASKQPVALVKQTTPKIVGTLPYEKGSYHIKVKSIKNDLVRIGEGLELFAITPNCASTTGMPQTIELLGDEFKTTSTLLKDGIPYATNQYTIIDLATLQFTALQSELPPKTNFEPYLLSVQNGAEVTETKKLYVYPTQNLCGTLNPTLLIESRDNSHTSIEDLTDQLSEDDGHYYTLPTNELLHLELTNTQKQGDYTLIAIRCHATGTLNLLREGTTTIVGTASCTANTWETIKLYITTPGPASKTWDIQITTKADIDYLSGWTI